MLCHPDAIRKLAVFSLENKRGLQKLVASSNFNTLSGKNHSRTALSYKILVMVRITGNLIVMIQVKWDFFSRTMHFEHFCLTSSVSISVCVTQCVHQLSI